MDDNMALNLNMTCGLYDRSQPLIDGRVKPRDIDLDIYVNSDDRSRQRESRDSRREQLSHRVVTFVVGGCGPHLREAAFSIRIVASSA